jgi:membrane-associated phospholipid phosphatase
VVPRAGLALIRPAERLLLAYLGLVSLVGLARVGSQPAILWVLVANGLTALLVFLAMRPGLGAAARAIRELYPLLLLGALYPAIDILNNFGAIVTHDRLVRGWELAVFGEEVSRLWWQHAPSVVWSTILHAAYFSYYPIILGPLLYFVARGDAAAAQRTTRWVLSTFLICYVIFLFFPVAGPYYEYPRPAAWFLANPAARLVYATLAAGSAYGAAFPSSHVAAALVATAAAYRSDRWVGVLLSAPAALLSVGVVYCQMHYGVDAIAGVVLAVAVVGAWLAWEGRQKTEGDPEAPLLDNDAGVGRRAAGALTEP